MTPRTVQNYCYRFLKDGPQGLKDRRTGNHRKLSPLEKAAIVTYKLDRPQRSARLIRDRLRLGVSEEAVRLILVKHRLSGSGALANSGPTVCRGSGATYRLKSGPGNYRYTPVAKIRFVGRPTRLSGSRKLFIREDCKLAGRTTREPIEPRDCKMRVPTLWSDGEGRCHL